MVFSMYNWCILEKEFRRGLDMNKEPIIETDRLILRSVTIDDAEACFSWNTVNSC